MSQTVQTTSLSKEMSSEESYSKTSISSSTTVMSSQESSIQSSSIMDSSSALIAQMEADLSLKEFGEGTTTGSKMATLEKSSSIAESESSISVKKAEMASSVSVEESSTSMSMTKEQSIKMSSEEVSKSAKFESISSEVSEEKDSQAYVVLMDYKPREGDYEGLRVKEGQEVEVIDSSKAHKWRVRLKKSGLEGTIPSCYLERKGSTTPPPSPLMDAKVQAAIARREKVLKELVESEEAFAQSMQYVVNYYIKEMDSKQMPKELRDYKDTLFTNFTAISEFHNNVLMKGIQYYMNEQARIGKTFLRLERDFDMHVSYCRDEPEAQQLLISGDLKNYFDAFSKKLNDDKTLSEHLKLPIQRINDYQLLLKELIKYTARLKEDTTDLEKAHDFMQAIPQRIADLQYLNSIQGYKGNLHKLGRILKHDWFEVIDCNNVKKERFLFLFKARIFITDHKRVGTNRSFFIVKNTIKFSDVEIVDNADDDELKLRFQSLKKDQAGYPIAIRAKSSVEKEEWLKAIQVTCMPQAMEDLGDDEPEPLPDEPPKKLDEENMNEKNGRVEVLEDFEAYEEMHTVITESVRSGSLTSLDDFHSALEDEPSLCFTTSEAETGGPGRPRFVKPLRARSCAEGAEAVLECEICSNTEATVAWLKDNAPLKATQKAIVQSDNGKHRLILRKAEPTDAGLYTIIASNVNGTVSCSAPLAVHSAPDMLPPTSPGGSPMHFGPLFLEKLKDMELQEGTAFRMCVIIQGDPTPEVKFYKEDQEINAEGRVKYVQESKECYELVIDNVQPEDKGKYSCVATSSCGQNVTLCNISVAKQKPIFKTPEGDLEKESTPEYINGEQAWPKDSTSIAKEKEEGENFKMEIDESKDTLHLVFQHVTPGDTGMYTRVASTGSGKISCSAELTVQGGLPREPEAAKASATTTEVTAKEGGSAMLELTATGYPKPRVTWTKDGKELSPGDKYAVLQEDEESFTMAIKNVNPGDSGKYSALAKNELGESSVDYNLLVSSPPKFLKPMKDSSAVLNEDMAFEVEIQGSPEPTITWCKDGQQPSESDRVKIQKDGAICKLIIKDVKLEDAGTYSCTIKNAEGAQAGFGALQVKAPPKFVQGLKDISVNLDQDIALKVKIAGSPTPDIKWNKDGSEIKADGTRIIQKEESSGVYSLTIKKCTKSDAGEYSCEISNIHGKDKTTGKVETKEKPAFEQLLEDKTLTEGEKDVDLIVRVSGKPLPKLKWYIKDMEIKDSSQYKIISDEVTGSSTLRIKEVTKEVEGTYKCEASNEAGKTETTSKVTVKEGKPKSSAPKFVKGLKDLEVKEGETATFTVKISGIPKPEAKWCKDDAKLTIDGKHVEFKTEEAEDSLTLTIHNATKEDCGRYTCTITNSEGSETTSSKLTVSSESKEKSASFREGLKDKTIKEGETVEFTVKYEGNPKPTAKWNKDDAELTIDGKHIEQKTDETAETLTLIIHDATKDDCGKYSCTVKNSAGSDTTTSKLTVEEKTESAKFVKGLTDVSVKEDESAEFTVKISGKPKPTAKWTKDGAELTIDGKHFQYKKEEAEDSLTLVLDKATKEDAGKYTCTITNKSGSDSSSSELKVTVKSESAKFEQKLKDQTVKEEEDVVFTVKFSGKPKPSAKWTKDGAELTIDGKKFEYKKEEAEDTLTVILKKASKEDAGKYSCTISNSAGSDASSSEVKVTEKTEAAKFVKGLKDESVKEEENVEFTIKFTGKPKPSVKWTKDGAELTIDNKRFQYKKEEAEDSLTLVLQKASKDDAGKYSCTITNSAGSDTSSSQLQVTDAEKAPKFLQGLQDQSAKEEQTVKFNVKFEGKPKPTAKWNKDGAELTIDGKQYKIEEAENSLTLILNSASKEDAGKYSCVISNTIGSETTTSKLTVSDNLSVPEFKEGLKDKDIKIGETVQMTVKFSGKPKPTAKWTLDGAELTIDDKRVQLKSEDADTSLTLVINTVTIEDAGKYSCTISNSCGSKTSSGKLSIIAPPAFIKQLQDTEGEMNGTARLNVKFEGCPEPTVIWKKDGTVLDLEGKHLKAALEGDDSLSLVFDKVSSDDAGNYTCEIKNPHGSASSSAKLIVSGKPVIKRSLEDKEAVEDEKDVELSVEVKATPAPEVKWSLNGKELSNDDNYLITADDNKGIYKLIIKKVTPGVAGKYNMEAKNATGKVDSSGELKVLIKPCFIKELKDMQVLEGDELKLEVSVQGCPNPTITWLKGKKEIAGDNRCQKIDDGQSHSLVFKESAIDDAGTYSCKAKNKVGEASQKANITVKSKKETQGPAFLTHLKDQVIVVADAGRFEVNISGKPQPNATWYKNEDELKDSDDVIIKSEGQTYTLTLRNLKVSDSGTYTCKAVNEYGEASESAILTVKEPVAPEIEGLENVVVAFGAPVRLKVKISGFPFPEVIWSKDGVSISKKDEIFQITEEPEINKHALAIKSVKQNEIGEITCVASNSAGKNEASCKVSIKAHAPVITKELSDQAVEIEDPIKFLVEVHGYPAPTIIWTKDGVNLENDSRFVSSKSDEIVTLKVEKACPKDAGTYICKATNEAGTAMSRAVLKIKDFAPIITEKLPSNMKLMEGEKLHLKAKINGQPTPEVKWLKDGKALRPSNRIKTEIAPDGTVQLTINDVTHDDSGNYKLVATNPQGHSGSECDVEVQFKAKAMKPFVQQMQQQNLVIGNPLKLEAKVAGNPKPTITWLKDGQPIPPSSRVKTTETPDGHAALEIDHATDEDTGEYTLKATNDLGEDTSASQVTVSAPGKKPAFKKELKPMQFLEGEVGKLEAIVSGYPQPTLTWIHNGKNVIEGQNCTISLDASGLASLTFPVVAKENGGQYTLTATNKLGKAITEAPIIVVPAKPKDEGKKPKKHMEFIKGLMPALVPEGRLCALEVIVTTDPKLVAVKWCKDGKEISSNEKIEIVNDFQTGELKLCVKQMSTDDRGKYSVIVSDGQSEMKNEALVNMIPAMPGMSGNKPYFIKGLEPVTLNDGETLKLHCQLAPECKCNVKWMKDGDDLVKGNRIHMVEQADGTLGLTIENVTTEDRGKYVVIASNEEGKTRSSAIVAVVGVGFRLPEIVNVLKPVELVEGEPARIEAKIDGEPKPEIKWLHNGEPVEPNERVKMVRNPDGTVALEIANVIPGDAGKYTLIVGNIGGETRCSAPVTVKRPPLFVIPLKDSVAVEGLPTSFECKVTGDPFPDIEWYKDGQEVPRDDSHVERVHFIDDVVALVFDKCTPQDSGNYACKAKNIHGQKSSESTIKVIGRDVEGQPKAAPAFVTPLSDISVNEGDSYKLEATVSGNPLPHVSWYLDDQLVPFNTKSVPTFDGKKVALSIRQCNAQHGGIYECRLTNSLGDASSKGRVKISGNKSPRFIEKLSDMKFPINQPMKLMCRVEGIPEPEVEWYFNGSKCENGLKYNLQREGDKCILVIPKPRTKDSGEYECRAKNIVGTDSCKARIDVSGADAEGEPPMFLKKLRDTGVLCGMTVKLTACITGFPQPEIQWFKDGQQFKQDNRRTIEADRNGVIRLIIRSVNKSDCGTYRVSISNMFGSETCTAKLELETTKDIEVPEKPVVRETGRPVVRETEKPVVRETEKPVKAGPPSPLPHAPYIFKMCDTSASLGWRPSIPQYPQVPSTYKLEMRKLPDGDWSTYKSGIKDSSCDIRQLLPNTDYEFRVKVENKYGVSEPSPYVTAHRTKLRPPTPGEYAPKDYEIEHPPLDKHAEAPRFLRKEEDQIYGVRGHPTRVEFWVYGYPEPQVTWYFNGEQVEKGKYDFLDDRNGQVILFISRMGDNDMGNYTCKAVNEHGEAQQKVKVLIAEPPAFIQRMAPTTVMTRKGGEFKCKVTGVPYPKIKWYKDWHPLSESSRIKIRHEEPESCYLTFSDAILKDCGLYSCVAANVAGSATSSAMLTVEECEQEYHVHTYRRPYFSKISDRPFEDSYDIGDELGRGTQGITYHAVERSSGKSYAAKVMHGTGPLMDFMTAEVDVMSQLCHPRLIRLWNAHATKSSLTLATDICGGGELLPHLLHQNVLTESLIAQYIKQVLEGLQHMHDKNIAHLGLTLGDILVTRLNSDSIKIGDFGLATKLYTGRNYIQEYGHPEYVAPEVANKQPVSLAADIWSVGIITYLLLTGDSPFLRENDRETLKAVQKGNVNFYHDRFVSLSDEARDFVTQLLQIEPSKRLDVNAALKHKWLDLASLPDKCDELNNQDSLRDYYNRWKSWYANASCKRYYRRRTLESCFTHPSRMIYPPDEEYTPPSTPDLELGRSDVKPSAFDDVTFQQRIEREPIDFRSESHYQNGPDTFLLPLRDPDFPVRIRRYLKVGANRSPILARHLTDKHWGYSDVAVKERRKFMDVMDEEIDDEKKGVSRSAPLRLRHEVGTVGSGNDHLESKAMRKKRGFRMPPGSAPYFREKIQDVVIRENEDAVFSCRVATEPTAQFSWFRNDGILIESSRILIKSWSDGRCTLTLRPAKAYDVGVYKCAARNAHGATVCRARLNIGSAPGKPEPPKTEQCSDTEVYLTWMPPKFEGHCPTLGYALEYKEQSDENWTKVASNISHEFFLVKDLKPSTTYLFRISATNRFGWSEFSAASEPTLTLAESAPKIQLSRAQKYQQECTEGGQALLPDEPEDTKLDYSVEDDPIEAENGEPTELYNFISEISRGRFSVVLKVWVKKANTACVAKACQITDATSDSVKREFEIYKSLQHEKIARLHSATISTNCLILVMEKLSGIDVLTYLSTRQLYTEETVSRIIHQVVDALQYLHYRNICYFELQPDNVVMVDRHNSSFKLVDFGSAQYVPEEGGKVQVKGSLEYLAPEVLKGEDVHSSVDIWGVGVLTYILLSGVSPFAGESDLETKDNVLFVRYHFDHLYKDVSQEATHFIMQLFKRTPQKRPTTEECLENKWLLPNEYMIKKREHAVFLSHNIREFSEQFHSLKSQSTPSSLLNMFGKPLSKSSSLDSTAATTE